MKKTDYLEDQLINQATVFHPGEGERLELAGASFTFKVTSEMSNNQLGIYEIKLPPHTVGARLHYHRFMDETFIAQKGILTVYAGGEIHHLEPGSVAYVPRFTPHGFANDTNEEVVLTLIFNPAEKREGFFRGMVDILSEQPVDPNKFLKLYNKYDSFPVDVNNVLPGK
ncbi:cupin domain-containing protein [Chitinophaga sp. Cy-1792]|uniref:cupin domain-containing protein n=1 Tax=Chitinophaga sp. Cy-1792 TaxID=2608339 RepID=UPI00142173B1|nr:cupin domain-containing protein [Chitinophaga sp. Cy-1792]NIG55795.1 cupin domain-containing protein [Chitinophaga sp. Cy-1792]